MFRRLGVPVHDADAAVHRLLGPGGGAVAAVAAAFPGVDRDGAVDRRELGRRVFGDPVALRRLEALLHPAVRRDQRAFLQRAARRGCRLAVLDVPLLFETGADARCDAVAVVSAPHFVQEARVLSRPGMTRQRLAAVRAQQMADAEKRRRADFLIPSGLGRRETLRVIRRIVAVAEALRPGRWPWPNPR
jgi:dephospho-CoA kinase